MDSFHILKENIVDTHFSKLKRKAVINSNHFYFRFWMTQNVVQEALDPLARIESCYM